MVNSEDIKFLTSAIHSVVEEQFNLKGFEVVLIIVKNNPENNTHAVQYASMLSRPALIRILQEQLDRLRSSQN